MKRRDPRRLDSLARVIAIGVPAESASFGALAPQPIRAWVLRVRPLWKTLATTLESAHRYAANSVARVWSKCAQPSSRRLRVTETVSLGEKRFVALVSIEGREFLIGGAATGISMLARLGKSRDISQGERRGE